MSNLEHVELLKKSVSKWNQWREENPEVTPDLKEANLQETNLEGANLKGADLQEADLLGADMEKTNLRGANFRDTDLRLANLNGADLTGAINLKQEQINSVICLDKKTRVPHYLEVKITGENRWTCKELK